MAEVIIMPKLGFDMDEGQLVKWHKTTGDPIRVGEIFFEINTDKTTMPVESPMDGTVLKILLEEGEFAAVFTPIAVVGAPGDDADAALASYSYNYGGDSAAQVEAKGDASEEADNGSDGDAFAIIEAEPISLESVKLTPRAKKYIADNNIDPGAIAQMKGTGFDGGITESDIKASIAGSGINATPLAKRIAARDGVDLAGVKGSGHKGKIMKLDVESQGAGLRGQAATPADAAGGMQILSTAPYKGIRKIIGEKLAASMAQSPHIYFTDAVDTAPMTKFRADVSEALGEKISVTDILALAASRALTKYPGVNSALVGDDVITYRSTNIGIAVAGDKGLIVPVIRDVQQKNMSEIAQISRDLIERARTGSLKPEEYSGGTFTISNLGMFGIDNFTAIINPPEAAIIAISAAKKKPVVVTVDGEDQIAIKSMMNIQLSVDHRLIDGLLAAQFVAYYKELLENPIRILI
jgi:pyruvate dehydrogenase E2 component (dihydrolipoamide acetyltransferase)